MAEIKVNVTASKQQRVTVSSLQNNAEITASADTGRIWAQTSKNWAISDVIVDNTDYSSKHYAQEAKTSAQNAESYENSVKSTYNSFIKMSDDAIAEIQGTKEETLTDIETSRLNAVDNINTVKNTAVDSINATKTTILKDIEFVADGEKEEIQELAEKAKDNIESTGFYMRDDKLYFINSEGEEQEFKSGGGGLEIGDIGFTQMAIDESKGLRRALNKVDNIIIQEQYPVLTQRIKKTRDLHPEYFCTEEEWQTELAMSAIGLCDKFVIDDNAGTIRLPKYPNYLDLTNNTSGTSAKTATVSVKGSGKSLGIYDNLGGTAGIIINNNNFAVRDTAYDSNVGSTYSGSSTGLTNSRVLGVTTDPSKSGLTGSVTIPAIAGVTSEKIVGTYFIQVATGSETEDNIINEIELNNPFPLLDYKYSEYELNNISWLRSEGQYNSKAVYPAVYDLLLKIYNGTETKAGVSVKLNTETFTDYDFVLNTAEETFRLPLLNGDETLFGTDVQALSFNTQPTSTEQTYTVPYNGYVTIIGYKSNKTNTLTISLNGHIVSQTRALTDGLSSESFFFAKKGDTIAVVTDSASTGWVIATQQIVKAIGNGSLYFYVGETVQNANLINAGRIEETLVKKVDMQQATIASFPSNRYIDLTLGAAGTNYIAPANGFVQLSASKATQVDLVNTSTGIRNGYGAQTEDTYRFTFIPVKKGDGFCAWYSITTLDYFRFIYAEGEL